MTTAKDVTSALRDVEKRRCEAISTGNLEALESLLDDDLTHTHRNGLTQGKDEYLKGLAGRPRSTSRGPLDIRVLGDVALMLGVLENVFEAEEGRPSRVVRNQALQVWVRRADGWKQTAFASSPLPEVENES